MVLFNLPIGKFFSNIETKFLEFPDGTAQLIGTVSDNNNSDDGFTIEVYFENKMNWEEWSNQSFPTSFKDECGTGNHENWEYYVMSPRSQIVGFGAYQGSLFSLSHAPENKFFAYQVGVGANNVNANAGNGGWFIARGELMYNGQIFPGIVSAGDFAFDGDCCTTYEIERTWVATDCAGNSSTVGIQIITVEPTEEGSNLNGGIQSSSSLTRTSDFSRVGIVPNPTVDRAVFNYSLNKTNSVSIDLIDIRGVVIKRVVRENAQADTDYNHIIETSELASGIYFVKLTTTHSTSLHRLVVAKSSYTRQ